MAGALYPYQEIGDAFLSRRETALLADDMGLGKSAQVVAACDRIGAKRVAVICPASVRVPWAREFASRQRIGRPIAVLDGKQSLAGPGVSIASYGLADRLCFKDHPGPLRYDVLVLDEAHLLKNRDAARSEVVLGIPKARDWLAADDTDVPRDGLASVSSRTWLLTGTPILNNPGELYPLLERFYPAALVREGGKRLSKTAFIRRYCRVKQVGIGRFVVVGGKRLDELARYLQPWMLRRLTSDVQRELPPLRVEQLVVEAGAAARELMELESGVEGAALRAALASFEAGNLSALDDLAVHVTTLRRLIGLAKVGPVAALVAEEQTIRPHKVILFAWHREVAQGLAKALARFGTVTLTGDTPAADRQKAIDAFQHDKAVNVFVGQIRAAGVGTTLTAAAEEIIVEPSWVPADNAQAVKRAHRIGQAEPVRARFVSLAGSIDERVSAVLVRKAAMAAEALGDARPELTLADLLS